MVRSRSASFRLRTESWTATSILPASTRAPGSVAGSELGFAVATSLLGAGRGGLLSLEGSDGAGHSDTGGRAELALALPVIFGSVALAGGDGVLGANSIGGVLRGGTGAGGGAD